MITKVINLKKKKDPSLKTNYFIYTLKFASLFIPHSIKDISLYLRSSTNFHSKLLNKPDKKILIKQSYIFLIWLDYLTNLKTKKKNSNYKIPKFFIYPPRKYKTTIAKAPMAHKTRSQEQFVLYYYKLSISFRINLTGINNLNSINNSIYFFLKTKLKLPNIGTNMFFLHKYRFSFLTKDSLFFSLKSFKLH